MNELLHKLGTISDVYPDFVIGVLVYVKKKKNRLDIMLDYLNSNDNLTSSDVLEFMLSQPDFREDNVGLKEAVTG